MKQVSVDLAKILDIQDNAFSPGTEVHESFHDPRGNQIKIVEAGSASVELRSPAPLVLDLIKEKQDKKSQEQADSRTPAISVRGME